MWLREHNRVAAALAALNPRWNDETLFQEARRVVVGEWQTVVFRDWLPWLLGKPLPPLRQNNLSHWQNALT